MSDLVFIQKQLDRYDQEEKEALGRLAKAQDALTRAKAELAAAKETLAGIRGAKKEFQWELEYLNEHGRLP